MIKEEVKEWIGSAFGVAVKFLDDKSWLDIDKVLMWESNYASTISQSL